MIIDYIKREERLILHIHNKIRRNNRVPKIQASLHPVTRTDLWGRLALPLALSIPVCLLATRFLQHFRHKQTHKLKYRLGVQGAVIKKRGVK
jgi:hypothetical protein